MPPTSDDLLWVPQSRILILCGISRATLNSWVKGGLALSADAASYDFTDLITLLVFASARKHMSPKHLVSAWTHLEESGEATRIVKAAAKLEAGAGFDLVIDPEFGGLSVTLSEAELLEAVRHPTAPRPVVVVDMAERVRDAVAAFRRFGSDEEPPAVRKRGRPRNASRSDESRPLRLVVGGQES